MDGILILTTGGTIDKTYFDALSEYQIGDSVVDRVLKTARVTLPFRIVELLRKDSLELTDADRAGICAAVRDARRDPRRHHPRHRHDDRNRQGAERGSRARRWCWSARSRPARFAESDAPFNLGMAFADRAGRARRACGSR